MSTIDELDVEILHRLTLNSRVGIAELASELGVSRTTINLRLKRLEDDEILLGFRPVIDLTRVGFSVHSSITISTDQRRIALIVNELSTIPEVLEVRIQAGNEDLVAQVAIRSLEELQELTSRIVSIPGVQRTRSGFDVATPVPLRVIPLLKKLVSGRGWGRSTPFPN